MPSAAALRLQIENALATRIPGALTPRPRIVREVAATGIPELDAVLGGGLPVGAISELVGSQSSGRTTLALAVLAEATCEGKTVAWVDASDVLDPESAAAAGVDLTRLLWVRCGSPAALHVSADSPAQTGQHSGAALLVEGSYTPAHSGGCGSPHPRGEARGLSDAVDAFLHPDVFSRPAPPRDPAVPRRNRMIGTPSAPNRKVLDRTPQDARPMPRRARDREEQIPTDRQPSRRQVLYARQQEGKTLQTSQILHTAEVAAARPQAGTWTDNANNAHGRCLATPPNAIAAGLPRFREMEARAAGQGHGAKNSQKPWKPSLEGLLQPGRAQTPSVVKQVPATCKLPSAPSGGAGPHKVKGGSAPLETGQPPANGKPVSPVWKALDQALRSTDLLLAAGGFSMLVLDLGSVPATFAWRIPLATWFRFRAAADRAQAVFVLLTQHACARSSAELVLRLSPCTPVHASTVLTGANFRVSVDRRRFESSPAIAEQPVSEPMQAHTLHLVSPRKQPMPERSTTWQRAAAWTGTGPATGSQVRGSMR